MGRKHNFEILEILLVCHGGVHNDTICMAERKTAFQDSMFPPLDRGGERV